MNWFFSFLDTQNPLSQEEDFDVFNSQVEDLVFAYLRRYIRIYRPSYTFEEAKENILSTDVTDDFITFTFKVPGTKTIECFGFGINVLEEIEEETKKSVQRICFDPYYIEQKINTISPETIAIIHSWFPEIIPENIVMIDIIPFDDGTQDFEYRAWDDHIELYYLNENNETKYKWVPNVFKWEYKGTANGLYDSLWKERRAFIRGILDKKNNPE